MSDTAISVKQVSKTFNLPHEKQSSIKGLFLNLFSGKRTFEKQRVLKNVSFEIKHGEFFGIIGRNGSGKSTLLKLLAGIYVPNKGAIRLHGKLTPFIELGVGFNPELTGRENVYLNGALLGFNRKQMDELYDEIVDFAELEKFMDQKLKNYSSGMQVRLAFSIAIQANSDILLLDEVLAVGDAVFQKKCYDYFKQLKKNKKTVVFVSHDASALREYCDRAILIENGEIITSGKASDVLNEYSDILNRNEEAALDDGQQKSTNRWGTGQIQAQTIEVYGQESSQRKKVFNDSDDEITVTVDFKAQKATDAPIYGVNIADISGQAIFTSNTQWSEVPTSPLEAGKSVQVTWRIPNIFNTGTYVVSAAVAEKGSGTVYDWRDEFASFKVRKAIHSTAMTNIAHRITLD